MDQLIWSSRGTNHKRNMSNMVQRQGHYLAMLQPSSIAPPSQPQINGPSDMVPTKDQS